MEATNKVAFKSGMILLQSVLSTPSDASILDEYSILKNGQSVLSTNFRENIRQYNSALSFAPMGEVNAKSKNVNGKGLTLKVAFTQFLTSLPSLPTQISLTINKL